MAKKHEDSAADKKPIDRELTKKLGKSGGKMAKGAACARRG
jgi:hypothetical protein